MKYILLLLFFSLKTFSCSCEYGTKSFLEVYHNTEYVFHGKVISINNEIINEVLFKKINFLLIDNYKNTNLSYIDIYTPFDDSNCGLDIKNEGEEWIIWAYIDSQNKIYTNQCTFSKSFFKTTPFEKSMLEKIISLNGYNSWFNENNEKIAEGLMNNGVPNGKWIYYNRNFIYSEGSFIDGEKNNRWITYYNPIFEFVNLSLSKEISEIYNSSNYKTTRKVQSVENYKKGIKEGDFITYEYNGQLKIKEIFKNNLLNGLCYYYENGQLLKLNTVKDGKLNGITNFFHKNGIIQLVSNYKNGIESGKWFLFDDNGNLLCKSCKKNPIYNVKKELFECP